MGRASLLAQQFGEVSAEVCELLTGTIVPNVPLVTRDMMLEWLLTPDPNLKSKIAVVDQITRQTHLAYVVAETNSCYKAGKAGVSDVFWFSAVGFSPTRL